MKLISWPEFDPQYKVSIGFNDCYLFDMQWCCFPTYQYQYIDSDMLAILTKVEL